MSPLNGFGPDPRIVAPRVALLTVRPRPDLDGSFEYWLMYRPDVADDPDWRQVLSLECARRIDSLVKDGPDGPWTWEFVDGYYYASLVERDLGGSESLTTRGDEDRQSSSSLSVRNA